MTQSDHTIATADSLAGSRPLDRLAGMMQYRTLAYVATFFSGAVSLTFQVVWQRYLSFMVGSEAKSISLVVAVFLLGLAAGYRFWGNATTRGWTRRSLLKAVGFIELGIAVYGALFITLFPLVRDTVYRLPDLLIVDFAGTAALLLIPTFLMGSSIPLLTAAIPSTMQEVNYCHTRIYGINTLGAFVGTFVAGFILVPAVGLLTALVIGSIVNVGVGLAFLFNTVEGDVQKGEETPSIPNRFGTSGIYLFVFITGAVTIAFEVLFMRLLALGIGSGHYVFPIVVGVVILGLAIGSLSIRRGSVTANRVIYELIKLGVLLSIVYFTVPYWGLWLSDIRVSLTPIPTNYTVYMACVIAFMMILLLPVVIPMGRLLPMGYSLIDKNSSDYGKMCGRVYFSNTIGTVVGAVGIGYMLLAVLNVDEIFIFNIGLILLLAAYLVFRQHNARAAMAWVALAILLPLALFLLPWDRQLHVQGLFRMPSARSWHFQGPFFMPNLVRMEDDEETGAQRTVLFLEDDPSVTVAVTKLESPPQPQESRTIFVNGKSDGNTVADYSNMALTAVLPYLHAARESELDAAVVGLGMGITSGSLAIMPDVREVTTLEISTGVIKAHMQERLFDEANFDLSRNPKHRIVQIDAFRFFTRTSQMFDMIISEPSNPWVVGVENLYTPEFYQMVRARLNPNGIYFQWLQVYEIDNQVLSAIVANVARQFEHVDLYLLGPYDFGILASNEPINPVHLQRRMEQGHVQRVLAPMAIDNEDLLLALHLKNTPQVRAIALNNARIQVKDDGVLVTFNEHRMDWPWLGHAAGKARFLARAVEVDSAMSGGVGRHMFADPARLARFERLVNRYSQGAQSLCAPEDPRLQHSTRFVCTTIEALIENYAQLGRPLVLDEAQHTLSAYHHLREYGYIGPDLALLDRVRGMLPQLSRAGAIEDPIMLIASIATEYALEEQWDTAHEVLDDMLAAGLLDEHNHRGFNERLWDIRATFLKRMSVLSDWESLMVR